MDLLGTLQALRRRWVLALILLAATAAGVGVAYVVLPWTYAAKANVLFLPSARMAKESGGNPYLTFSTSLNVSAEMLGRSMMDERTVADFKQLGYTGIYDVTLATNSNGPVLDVSVTASDKRTTQSTMDMLIKEIPQRLVSLQASGGSTPPVDSRIHTNVISRTIEPELDATSKIRNLVIIGAVGLVLTVGLPVFLEGLTQRKGRRRPDSSSRRTPVPATPGTLVAGRPRRVPQPVKRNPWDTTNQKPIPIAGPPANPAPSRSEKPGADKSPGGRPGNLWAPSSDAETAQFPKIMWDDEPTPVDAGDKHVVVSHRSANGSTDKRRRRPDRTDRTRPEDPGDDPHLYNYGQGPDDGR